VPVTEQASVEKTSNSLVFPEAEDKNVRSIRKNGIMIPNTEVIRPFILAVMISALPIPPQQPHASPVNDSRYLFRWKPQ
jgi:hypothetical protein